jgi:hypothetical protein
MLFWWIGGEKSLPCGVVVGGLGFVVTDLRCGGGDEVVIESIENVAEIFVVVFVVVVWWLGVCGGG